MLCVTQRVIIVSQDAAFVLAAAIGGDMKGKLGPLFYNITCWMANALADAAAFSRTGTIASGSNTYRVRPLPDTCEAQPTAPVTLNAFLTKMRLSMNERAPT